MSTSTDAHGLPQTEPASSKASSSAAPSKVKAEVWWTSPRSGGAKSEIKPYLDHPYIGLDMLHSMGELNDRLRMMSEPVPSDRRPTDLRWKLRKVTDKERDLPDAHKIYMGAIMVSEAFRDVASSFDLGQSQFIELPLYEAKTMSRMGDVEIDPDRRDPRRWFLFHILPRKTALLPDESSGVSSSKWPDQSIRWTVNVPGTPEIVLSSQALDGPDIWRDPALSGVIFFSDGLKRAIKVAKLRTPAFAFKPCRTA